jgi:hypothetical protein
VFLGGSLSACKQLRESFSLQARYSYLIPRDGSNMLVGKLRLLLLGPFAAVVYMPASTHSQ